MYTIIDIEGNGAGYQEEKIIDIALYKFDGQKIVDQFISLINPEASITPFVQKLTTITPKKVRTAPKFHEVAKRIVEITEGTTLVGHNIEFDYRMLRQEFRSLGYDFKINTLDTIPIAKKLLPNSESYSLGKLARSLGLPVAHRHTANGDALVTLELFKVLISKDVDNMIIRQLHEETNANTYLNKVRDLTQDLPKQRGILFFQNKDGEILYSQFAKDLQRIAQKKLHSQSPDMQEIQQKTEQIHYELVGNALLAEVILITRNLDKEKEYPYGLYIEKGKIRIKPQSKGSLPLLLFSAYTQATKAMRYIESSEWKDKITTLQDYFSCQSTRKMFWTSGRTLGEKVFFIIENTMLIGYGFYEFHTQISTWEKIQKRSIHTTIPLDKIENELKLSLLKNELFPIEIPA